jgi:hypothetical protein
MKLQCKELLILIILLLISCEGRNEFVRPDLPEKLCSITIIDADDTTNFSRSLLHMYDLRNSLRYFSLEKSKQSEYNVELTDSLQEFSYAISSQEGQLFSFTNAAKRENLFYMELPDSLPFISGENYFLSARENTLEAISAETIVPDPPTVLNLVSLEKKEYKRNDAFNCSLLIWGEKYHSAEVTVSFKKGNNKNQYYALFVDAKGAVFPMAFYHVPVPYSGPTDFYVRKCNAPYFYSEIQGINMVHINCQLLDQSFNAIEKDLAYALFIDGRQVPGDECIISLSIPFGDTRAPISSLGTLRIKLLTITEDFYMFEKRLCNYNKVKNDPFAEPVYLNGNIKGGNGIFTICRSTNIEMHPQWQ